jgi:hypothetical protein
MQMVPWCRELIERFIVSSAENLVWILVAEFYSKFGQEAKWWRTVGAAIILLMPYVEPAILWRKSRSSQISEST